MGFIATGKLKRIELETGLLENVVELPADENGGSAAWGPDGEIVFGGWESAFKRVPAREARPLRCPR